MSDSIDIAEFRRALAADTLSVADVDELLDALDSARIQRDNNGDAAVKHAYSCCDSPRGCAWPDRHTQPCDLHHGCSSHTGLGDA